MVGDNEPYHGALEGDTLNAHGTVPGLPVGDPKVELAGFGLEDTHSTATNLQFHVDGWLYGVNGSTTTGDESLCQGGQRLALRLAEDAR